jgi:hypothetical protein
VRDDESVDGIQASLPPKEGDGKGESDEERGQGFSLSPSDDIRLGEREDNQDYRGGLKKASEVVESRGPRRRSIFSCDGLDDDGGGGDEEDGGERHGENKSSGEPHDGLPAGKEKLKPRRKKGGVRRDEELMGTTLAS